MRGSKRVFSSPVASTSELSASLRARILLRQEKMSSGALIRAAFFTAGAVVGGGIAAALGSKKRSHSAPTPPGTVSFPTTVTPSPVSAPLNAPSNLPIVEVGVKGDPRVSSAMAAEVTPVLRYGNPGE